MEHKLITSQAIKTRYFGEDEQNHSVVDIIKYHDEDMQDKLKRDTQKNYYVTQKYLSKFILKTFKTTDIYLQELDYNFIIKFEKYLRGHVPEDHQKPMGNNTVMKHIERFRKLINLAFKLGWIERDPFVNFKAQFIKNRTRVFKFTGTESGRGEAIHHRAVTIGQRPVCVQLLYQFKKN